MIKTLMSDLWLPCHVFILHPSHADTLHSAIKSMSSARSDSHDKICDFRLQPPDLLYLSGNWNLLYHMHSNEL